MRYVVIAIPPIRGMADEFDLTRQDQLPSILHNFEWRAVEASEEELVASLDTGLLEELGL